MIPWWLLLIFLRYSTKVTPDEYTYMDPDSWKDDFPMCGGSMQSPISLDANRVALTLAPKLQFGRGLHHVRVEAINTGRTIKLVLRPENQEDPFLRISSFSKPFLGNYKFEQMHFHWGDYPTHHGSEHSIEGQYTDAEVHFVFYNTRYGSFGEAARNFDGILVIGILLRGTEHKRPLMFPTMGLEHRFWELSRPGKKFKYYADLTDLQMVLQRVVSKFFSYHGSLTTPPCNPVVTWMVSATEMGIDNSFLHKLSTSVYADDETTQLLVNNYRPVQSNLGRVITKHISIGYPDAMGHEHAKAIQ